MCLFRFSMKAGSVGGKEHNLGMVLLPLPPLVSNPRRGCYIVLSMFIFFFFRHDFVAAISLEPSLVQTPDWVCCLVLLANFALLLIMQFASLFFFFYFFLFFRQDFVRAISLELLLAETPNWVCCLVLWSNFALLLTIQFASLFFFFLIYFSRHDFATILSGPYLWNRYSQRLQIECAAWSCGLIVHYCLPSNSLCYVFFFFCFFPPRFCPGHISGTVTHRDSKLSVLLGPAV